MKIAFLFPGQGAQKVGMGKDLYEDYEEVRNVFEKASEFSKIDIATLCFNGIRKEYTGEYTETEEIGEDLIKTENTQLAIATLSLAILEILKRENINAQIACGLSLGEYPALIYSGFINFEDGIKLLKERGYLMQNKLPKKEYLMAAVIGLNSKNIEDICIGIRKQNKFVVPSNYNYQNQTVISGEKEAVEEACEILKNKGAKKVVLLKTSGPFHTSELEEAKELYKKELEKITFNKESKKTKVIKNIDGTFYSEKDNMVETLSNHIVSPVRFDKTMRLMEQNGIDTYVEIGPGKSLSGFIKKEVKDAKIINICDGVILPGGDNYSDIDLKLCRYLNEKDIPTFGICLGMQCMAEAFNGNVELLDTDNHYSKNEYVHRVTIKDNSFIYKILNCNSMYVNSRHKYCIVNTNLDISSYSDDFVIEGVEDKNKKFYVGVQWHPESMKNDINSRLLIEEFINKC